MKSEYDLISELVDKLDQKQNRDPDKVIEKLNDVEDQLKKNRAIIEKNQDRLDQVQDTEKEEDTQESDKYRNQILECFCGKKCSPSGMGAHLLRIHDVDGEQVMVNENGNFICRICDSSFSEYGSFKAHHRNKHNGILHYLFDHFSEEEILGDSKEKERWNGYEKNERKRMVQKYARENSRFTKNEMLEDQFNQTEFDANIWNSAQRYLEPLVGDVLRKTKPNGKNVYINKELSEPDIEPNHIEMVVSELGRQNWQLLQKAFFIGMENTEPLIPDEGEKRELNFYQFSKNFSETEDYKPRDMWEKILTNTEVQKALISAFDEDVAIWSENGGSGGIESKVLIIER